MSPVETVCTLEPGEDNQVSMRLIAGLIHLLPFGRYSALRGIVEFLPCTRTNSHASNPSYNRH